MPPRMGGVGAGLTRANGTGALKISVVRRSSERRSLAAVHITHEVSLSLVRPDTVSPSTADTRTTPLALRQLSLLDMQK